MALPTTTLRARRRFALCITGCLAVACVGLSDAYDYPLDNGTAINFDEAVGQWVIIAYWAIWCSPCHDETRILNTIHRQREQYNVIVLGMNFDGLQGAQLAAQKEQFDAKYPDLLTDPREIWGEPRPGFIPHTLIINPEGHLQTVIRGSTTRAALLKAISQ